MKLYLIIPLILKAIFVDGDQYSCIPDNDCALASAPIAVPDPRNCQNYYICNGKIPSDISFTCGPHAHFNGDSSDPTCIPGGCNSIECAMFPTGLKELPKLREQNILTTTCIEIDNFTCQNDGIFPLCSTCEQTYITCDSSTGSLAPIQTVCHDEKYFSPHPDYLVCLSLNDCEKLIGDLTTQPTLDMMEPTRDPNGCFDIAEYICQAKGVFPLCDTCDQNYVTCVVLLGVLTPIESTCNEEGYFNPNPEYLVCMPLDQCEILITTTTPDPTTTPDATTTTADTTTTVTTPEIITPTVDPSGCFDINGYTCISAGDFPLCETCHQNYISCVMVSNTLTAVESTCEEGGYFNPNQEYLSCMSLEECERLIGDTNSHIISGVIAPTP